MNKGKYSCRILTLLIIHIAFLLLLPASLLAWQGKVVKVIDGDTIEVQRKRSIERIRLYGIDAPEKDQPFGLKATGYLARLIRGNQVIIDEVSKDRYGRTVAMVSLDRDNVNQLLLQGGYAWVYSNYCRKSICKKWNNIEKEARLNKNGLWAASNPVPPWEWRKQDGSTTDKTLDIIQNIFWWIKKIMSYVKMVLNLFAD